MLCKCLHKFTKREDGTVLVFISMCIVVFFGMCAITFDLGRVAATQSDLQSYVDHVALAAAGELDGTSTAISRAEAAAADMIRDRQAFAEGGKTLGSVADYTIRFLDGLPADDTASTVDDRTIVPEDAQFVEVFATPRTVSLPFARALNTLLGRAGPDELVGAVAIAGSRAYACDVPVLMFCMPPDPSTITEGDSLRLRSKGGGNAWGAGNFGFLDPLYYPIPENSPCRDLVNDAKNNPKDEAKGSKAWTCMIASSGVRNACTGLTKGLKTTTGQRTGTGSSVFNTRFDMYDANMNKNQSDPIYAPSGHTITGLQSSSGGGNDTGDGTDTGGGDDKGNKNDKGGANLCTKANNKPSEDTLAFPPDDCIVAGTCNADADGEGGDDIYGDGNWSAGRKAYVNMNYGAIPGEETAGKYLEATTRFEFYQRELQAAIDGKILNNRSESGDASCFNGEADTSINRRVFLVAGIDCVANTVKGNTTGLIPHTYYEVFLLRPVAEGTGSSSKFDIDVEVIRPAGGFGNGNSSVSGIVRDVVVLHR